MKRFSDFKAMLITAMLVIFAIMLMNSASADAGVYWKQKSLRVSAPAGETLAIGNVVTIKDADGKAYKADANDAALRPAVGIVGKGGAANATVEIVVSGIIGGYTALTESGPGYLSETAGAITQVAPAYSQQLGYAISATEYVINCQNYFDSSSLTVLGTLSGATPLAFEGATANDFETSIAVTDPTADRTVTLSDASGTVMLSSLATNAPDVANSVTGASNGLVFEGATANEFETTIAATDPTADRTFTLPDATGTANLNCTATHDYAGRAEDWTLSVAEAQCGFITVTNANGAVNAILPAAIPGKTYTVNNASGQELTFKVTGKAGGTIASAKWGFYTTLAADVVEVYELP